MGIWVWDLGFLACSGVLACNDIMQLLVALSSLSLFWARVPFIEISKIVLVAYFERSEETGSQLLRL